MHNASSEHPIELDHACSNAGFHPELNLMKRRRVHPCARLGLQRRDVGPHPVRRNLFDEGVPRLTLWALPRPPVRQVSALLTYKACSGLCHLHPASAIFSRLSSRIATPYDTVPSSDITWASGNSQAR